MKPAIYWFRNDLRLSDNAALVHACQQADQLTLVYCLAPEENTQWGFTRLGQHRKAFLADTLADLAAQCVQQGRRLLIVAGEPSVVLPSILQHLKANTVYCEAIAAPYEMAQVAALDAQGYCVETIWQSSLLDPATLPFQPQDLPLIFTTFRQQIEQAGTVPPAPLAFSATWPAAPSAAQELHSINLNEWAGTPCVEARSAFPYHQPQWHGGATAALAHLQRYLASGLADQYKQTRNGLIGCDYSSKFSPWLASGALSARQIDQQLTAHEAANGANDSTNWIRFELLWRDYFRLLHLRFGAQLYRAQGLNGAATMPHQAEHFLKWCQGETGQPFIDAGMRELAATGYLSNRMRQNVASFLIHDLQCDWRAGAAWFESQLIDYDVYSNQGNWLYLAGRGTDPRPNRRFNIEKQIKNYDPKHEYMQLWRD
ncbi:DASH family cryptochrome [Deefgea salmonis]|uniref:Cryptochrome DASH n=1 Tax=Deefgea salmonis TaxID=2875502 RepID=A0ABS8BG64_9NEIS|nr:DASH family cryptochrome [Deefgea salmonis]MCB5194700.1 DASH family cryptochrome [Deefgea salmonis]